ncbi:formate/nitrite transporter family protein [Methanocalculus alkaliphilus]|uniref:formate/nitrite transporter family protein n=1 Tax=Methanocalculus alkaliphilus TaxID=768730 RepID=UPI0020A046E7|nr:formate/nitrite transporter family protein [Methanocalculus alkaliphilus]
MVFHPPVQIVAKAGDAGKYKVGLPWWNMIMRGFMSGAYIAMGAGLATVCGTGVADFLGPGFAALIRGAVFPVGLIITVLTGAELFTGDAMLAPMAAFIHKISWASVFNLWIWVYVGNVIGSLLYAYLMAYGPLTNWDATGAGSASVFGVTAVSIAWGKVNYAGGMAMWSLFLKAIGCNWLVNLAVLLGICADDAVGKFFGIWFPIMAFVSSGLEHSIANIYFIPAGIMVKGFLTPEQLAVHADKVVDLNWMTMWTNNVILVTIGNTIGGLFFVGVIYWVAFRKEIAALK